MTSTGYHRTGSHNCHPERSKGPLRPRERSLAALRMTAGPYLAFVIPGTKHHPTEKQAPPPMEFLRTILRKNAPVVRDRLIVADIGLIHRTVRGRSSGEAGPYADRAEASPQCLLALISQPGEHRPEL